ncbi:MAG: leucine-rich repeat domain-containing protein [Christensenellales bacterium]
MSDKRDLKERYIRADAAFEGNLQHMLASYRGKGEEERMRPLRLVLVSVLSTLLVSALALAFAGKSGALDFLFSPQRDLAFTYVTSYREGVRGWVITGYYGKEEAVVVPERIDRIPVSGIGAGAFARSEKLTAITLPASLATIGDSAFFACKNLASVSFAGGTGAGASHLSSIGKSAFADCRGLAAFSIPASVTLIEDTAFTGCAGLRDIILPDGLLYLGEGAFSDCEKLASINIPQGLEKLSGGLFAGCLSLERLEIPDSVKNIGAMAFYECRSLVSIKLPAGLAFIPDYAFWCCESLREVLIPQGVTNIGDSAFYWCAALESVALPQGVTAIGLQAFAWCGSLSGALLPDSLASIGEDAFLYCDSLKLQVGEGSYAQQYAKDKGIPFQIADR